MKSWQYGLLILLAILVGIFVLRACGSAEPLAGHDANQNGIRDDLEKLIDDNWGKDPKIKSAANYFAKTLQDAIIHPDTAPEKASLFAVDCLFYVAPEQAYEISKRIEEAAANTASRARALFKESARFNGKMLHGAKNREEACAFDSALIK